LLDERGADTRKIGRVFKFHFGESREKLLSFSDFSFSATGNTSKPKSEFTTCITGCTSVLEAFFLMKSRFFKVRFARPELRVRIQAEVAATPHGVTPCNSSISVR
jgi:hypothetical protein